MKKIFYSHPDIVLVVIAIVLIVTIGSLYSWVINDIYTELHGALASSAAQGSQSFNLNGAAALDLRGIATSTASSGAMPVVPVVPAPATTTSTTTPMSTASSSAAAATSSPKR